MQTTPRRDMHCLQSAVALLQEELSLALKQMPLESIQKLAEACLEAGAVVFLGVGKSGFVADKMAASMSSLGMRAFAMHPVEALHGDLGRILSGDVAVLISKSGETEELCRLLPPLHARRVHTWAMTSNPNSRLAAGCQGRLLLPECRELDPHNLVPTTSSTLQMMAGDLLLTELIDRRGMTSEEFHSNHPAGRIGRRLALRVQDLQLPLDQCPVVHPDISLLQALPVLSSGRSGCVLLVQEGKLTGIFTDGDLRRTLQVQGAAVLEEPIHRFATKTPRTVSPDELAIDALRSMETGAPVQALPVSDSTTLVGLLRLHDLVQAGI